MGAKLRENRLSFIGHMMRMSGDALKRMVKSLIMEGKRIRGKPKRTWNEQIKIDLQELQPLT